VSITSSIGQVEIILNNHDRDHRCVLTDGVLAVFIGDDTISEPQLTVDIADVRRLLAVHDAIFEEGAPE